MYFEKKKKEILNKLEHSHINKTDCWVNYVIFSSYLDTFTAQIAQ